MKNILFFFSFSFIVLISCKEESITPIPETTNTWEKVTDLPGDYRYLLKTKGNSIYMVCYNEGYKFASSQDSGKSWLVSDLGFVPKYGVGFLSTEGAKFFIAGEDGLFESSNNGITWSENISLRNYINPNYPLLRIPTLNCIDVQGSEVFLGQLVPAGCGHGAHVNGLFYSSDNGDSWSCPSSVETPWRVTAVKKFNNVLVISDFKVFFSEDSLNTWQVAYGGTGDVAEFRRDDLRLYAIHYGFIKYSDDKGKHWVNCTPSEINSGLGIISTFTFNQNTIFIMDDKGVIHHTNKSVIEWKTLDIALPAFDPFPYENQTMFTLGNDYLYYISNDKIWRIKITE
jgi:hypothetical protein